MQTRISDEEIFKIIERKGVFKVLRYHYRADKIRERCNKLTKRGILKFAGIEDKQLLFKKGEKWEVTS
jgi:hypothetical protein